jgi:hypothetical protein
MARRQLGLAYLPSPWEAGGLIGTLTLLENAALGQQRRPRAAGTACSTGARSAPPRSSRQPPSRSRCPAPGSAPGGSPPATSSGSRWQGSLPGGPACWSLPPTNGLDWASTALVWRRLRQEARAGLAVLLWSTDPEELLAPADRVGVMAGGRVVANLDPTCLSATDLVRALADPVAFESPTIRRPGGRRGPGRWAGDGPRVACLGRRRSPPLARLAWVLVPAVLQAWGSAAAVNQRGPVRALPR